MPRSLATRELFGRRLDDVARFNAMLLLPINMSQNTYTVTRCQRLPEGETPCGPFSVGRYISQPCWYWVHVHSDWFDFDGWRDANGKPHTHIAEWEYNAPAWANGALMILENESIFIHDYRHPVWYWGADPCPVCEWIKCKMDIR